MIIAGIDYSMSSPAVCIHKGSVWNYKNCSFYYIAKRNKDIIETEQFKGILYPEFLHQQQRFNNLAGWALKILNESDVSYVAMEGYSYGSSSSRLFEIGENTGLLKYKMWDSNIKFDVVAPTAVKKFATGKGNANKEKMWDSFLEETNINIFNLLGLEEKKNWNPVSDMVDAYYICKFGFENLNAKNNG